MDEVPEAGPRWLSSGQHRFSGASGHVPELVSGHMTHFENQLVRGAHRVTEPLSTMETRTGFEAAGSNPYEHSILAAELLASYVGPIALMRYYTLSKDGTRWQQNFQTVFGVTVPKFYQLFEEHRADGFPCLRCPSWTADDYIVWQAGDEVSADAEAETQEVVQAVHDYAASNGLPRIGGYISIFLYQDLDALSAEFEAAKGRPITETWYWPDLVAGNRVFVAGRDWIVINALATRYQEWSPHRRKQELGTRLIGVYENLLTGIWEGTPRDQVPPAGPVWLSEGFARYFTYQSLRTTAPDACDTSRNRYALVYPSADTHLSELETSADFWALDNASRYAFLAVELLAEQAGPGAIVAYYDSLHPRAAWQEAFHAAFRMTAEEFYELFEERRSAGFTEPRCETLPKLETMAGSPEYIKWAIGSNVDPEHILDSVEGVRLMHEYGESLGMPEIMAEFGAHLYYDQAELVIAYQFASPTGGGWINRGAHASAIYRNFFTNTLRWEEQKTSLHDRKKISAHELFHLFQYEWSSGEQEPHWLIEGTAEFLAFRELEAGGASDYAEQRSGRLVPGAKRVIKPLNEILTWRDMPSGGYSLSLLAAELLASHAGEGALFRYFVLLQPITTWQQAFESAFGMPVEEYYDLFEKHRADGFPYVEIP